MFVPLPLPCTIKSFEQTSFIISRKPRADKRGEDFILPLPPFFDFFKSLLKHLSKFSLPFQCKKFKEKLSFSLSHRYIHVECWSYQLRQENSILLFDDLLCLHCDVCFENVYITTFAYIFDFSWFNVETFQYRTYVKCTICRQISRAMILRNIRGTNSITLMWVF